MASGDGSKAGDSGEDARVSRTRADVARAALEVLTTDGSDAVTHARVAEIAGYSKTTLYTHWPARIDLIAMAIESLGDMPHHERTGVLRDDLIGIGAAHRRKCLRVLPGHSLRRAFPYHVVRGRRLILGP